MGLRNIAKGLETKVVSRIEEIPVSDWESVYPKALEGYRFFQAMDDSNLEQFSTYYILVYRDGRPAGAASCFLMNYSLDTTVQGLLKTVSSFLRKVFPGVLDTKTLMCGSPIGPGRMGVAGNAQDVFGAIYKAIDAIAEKEKVAIVAFKEFDSSYRGLFSGLADQGFHRFDSFPNTDKEIHYKDFDAYLMSLSYKTRYDLKRKFKKVDGHVPIDLEMTHHLGGALEEAYGLYRQVIVKHPVEFEVLPREFFANVSKHMPEETRFFLWRMGGKLVAFAFCLVSSDYLLDYYLGLDYSVAYEYHLYFVRFKDIMNWCIQNGIRKYEMGCTNYDPKKRLGFRFIPLDVYAKHRNRWINSLLKVFCGFLEPKRFDPILKQLDKSKAPRKRSLTWAIFSIIMLVDAIDTLAQILMKKGLPAATGLFQAQGVEKFLLQSASSGMVWAGIFVYASNFFLWMIVLSQLELSVAIVLASTNYLVLPVVSIFILHEKVTFLRWAGVFFIVLGVYFVSRNFKESRR